MIDVYERHVEAEQAERILVLTHEQRSRGRIRTADASGEEVRIFLDRGEALQIGEVLRGENGELLRVLGAVEAVLTARCNDWEAFSKACYHLGNRHVKIQIGERWLRIVPDHVLAQMLEGLGLEVQEERAVFDPEGGAYAQGHSHSHAHGHSLLLNHAHAPH